MDTFKTYLCAVLWSVIAVLLVVPISNTVLAQAKKMNEPTLEEIRTATKNTKI